MTDSGQFHKGDRVEMTEEGLHWFRLGIARGYETTGVVSTTPRPGAPNVGVIRDGVSSTSYYAQEFWRVTEEP